MTTFDINKLKLLILDFDGVLTNNKVYVNGLGEEMVSCSRADGLAFDALRKLGIKTIILSTETNKVVTTRADKLKLEVKQGINNKKDCLQTLLKQLNLRGSEVAYVGNDINDIGAMSLCGMVFCPEDSHQLVKEKAILVLQAKGGEGVIRELLEHHFKVNIFKLLY